MNEEIANYIYKHTFLITLFIIAAFAVLAAGQFVIYKNQLKLNQMMSEGFMQLKEEIKNQNVQYRVIPDSNAQKTPQESPIMKR